MASCSICYDDNKIKNDYNCRTCKNSVCNSCFSNILSYDDNFRICMIYNIPIIYKCSFCKTENRLRNFNNEIQKELIEILEKKLNIQKNV
jgi:hypothetical protein